MFAPLRRRVALFICPEFRDVPHQAAAFERKAKSPHMALAASQLRSLDRLYALHTGVRLTHANAPIYTGSMYLWRTPRERVARAVISLLLRLRRDPICGTGMTNAFVARCYFSSIWPADLEWPRDIPRPPKSKEAA